MAEEDRLKSFEAGQVWAWDGEMYLLLSKDDDPSKTLYEGTESWHALNLASGAPGSVVMHRKTYPDTGFGACRWERM